MGLIHPGIPRVLALKLARLTNCQVFVETGACYGDTTEWAAHHFPTVVSIEADERLYNQTRDRLLRNGHNAGVVLYQGKSPEILPRIATSFVKPLERAMFWLDAHWSGEGTGGQESECPLLEEIAAIQGRHHVILIDDARYFLSPPRPPHDPKHWPNIRQIIHLLRHLHPHEAVFITVHDDVIWCLPDEFREPFLELIRETAGARTWRDYIPTQARTLVRGWVQLKR